MKTLVLTLALLTCALGLFAQQLPVNNFPFSHNQSLTAKAAPFNRFGVQRFDPASKIYSLLKQRNHSGFDLLSKRAERPDLFHPKTVDRATDSTNTHYLPLSEIDSSYSQYGSMPGEWAYFGNIGYQYHTTNCLDSVVTNSNPQGVNNFRDLLSFDNSGNETQDIFQDWNGSVWVNEAEYLWEYPYENCPEYENFYELSWNGTAWDTIYGSKYYQLIFTGNLLTKVEVQQYPFNSGGWQNNFIETFSYDSLNKLIGLDYAFWDTTTQQYDLSRSRDTLYNFAFYNSLCDFSTIASSYQVYENNQWTNSAYDTTYADSDGGTVYLYYNWGGSKYVLDPFSFKTFDSLDSHGNTVREIVQDYDTTEDKFITATNYVSEYKYGPNNELDYYSSIDYYYDIYADTLYSAYGYSAHYSDFITCSSVTGIHGPNSAIPFSLFPNPAGNTVYLKATMDKPASVQLILTDMLGKNLLKVDLGTLSGSIEKEIDISRFPSGMYLAKLTVNGQTQTLKVIKE